MGKHKMVYKHPTSVKSQIHTIALLFSNRLDVQTDVTSLLSSPGVKVLQPTAKGGGWKYTVPDLKESTMETRTELLNALEERFGTINVGGGAVRRIRACLFTCIHRVYLKELDLLACTDTFDFARAAPHMERGMMRMTTRRMRMAKTRIGVPR